MHRARLRGRRDAAVVRGLVPALGVRRAASGQEPGHRQDAGHVHRVVEARREVLRASVLSVVHLLVVVAVVVLVVAAAPVERPAETAEAARGAQVALAGQGRRVRAAGAARPPLLLLLELVVPENRRRRQRRRQRRRHDDRLGHRRGQSVGPPESLVRLNV